MSDVLRNKFATIERCIERIREDYDEEFRTNYTKQDAVILNIERACQASMDMAAHLIRARSLPVPQHSRELFTILEEEGILPEDLAERLRSMVGFRNIAVHNYTALNIEIIEAVVNNHLEDFTLLAGLLLRES